MAGSSNDKINYNVRSSKSIERKMILEVLKELCPPSRSSDFQYIGMGSAFFVDFKLFHKQLGISKMFSFEGKKSNVSRCDFNKPFNCIEIIPERTTKGLSSIDWSNNSIIWLDYEDELRSWMLEDTDTICINAKSKNVLLITLRRSVEGMTPEEFNDNFSEYLENEVTPDDLHKLNSHSVLKNIFSSRINNKLTNVFSACPEAEKIKFHPIFHFTYEDGAAMYTFGGVFLNENDYVNFSDFQFHSFDFINPTTPFNITCPIITSKEYHLMNSKVPSHTIDDFLDDPDLIIIPKNHRENFFRTYKYYPNFFEISD